MPVAHEHCPKCGHTSHFGWNYLEARSFRWFMPWRRSQPEAMVRDCEYCGYEYTEGVFDGD